jgi:endo-1,4-beta-xylanase
MPTEAVTVLPVGARTRCIFASTAVDAPRFVFQSDKHMVNGGSPYGVRGVRLAGIVALLAGAACGSAPTSPSSPTAPESAGDSLRLAAVARGKLVGTAIQSSLIGDPRYRGVVDREFDYITAEYEMKWDIIEPAQGISNFAPGDAVASYASSQGMLVKGHTLIWHGSVPGWLAALPATQLRAAFESHIRAVASHYRGRVLAWDVVNEAVADDGSGLRDTVFRQALGDQYIADAFRLAHDADPGALLFYNDYGGEGMNAKSNRIYELVKALRAQGVPLDGVGLQMHVSVNGRPSDASIAANMRRLADLGLRVNISEMDVRISSLGGTPQARLDAQRATYHDVVTLCVTEPRCDAVTFWGFSDAHTWINGDQPLLFDAQYARKPAYHGVLDALSGR